MKLLIKEIQIIDSSSPWHLRQADILIVDGVIAKIDTSIEMEADQIIQQKGLVISPGWVDIFAFFGEPGYEYKETLASGAEAAAAGGYTDVMLIPNTKPVVQNKPTVEYLLQKRNALPVHIHPMGSVTIDNAGKELTEMYDMYNHGAVAFTDGIYPIQSAGLLIKAMQYVRACQATIIQIPDDRSIQPSGSMNEGIISAQIGLLGKPALAENIMVMREIEISKYTHSPIHLTGISSAKSLAIIREAKENNVQVTCSVSPFHVFFTDNDLVNYDTNLKIFPPLRTTADREALQKGLLDGTVDCIASHHLPHEYDSKILEFENAKSGMTSLETCYAAIQTKMPEMTPERWVALCSSKPREIFSLPALCIAEGEAAKLTLFDPSKKWTVDKKAFFSASQNTPFDGMEFSGRTFGIVNGNMLRVNNIWEQENN